MGLESGLVWRGLYDEVSSFVLTSSGVAAGARHCFALRCSTECELDKKQTGSVYRMLFEFRMLFLGVLNVRFRFFFCY